MLATDYEMHQRIDDIEGCQPDPMVLHEAITTELDVDDFELTAQALATRSLRLRKQRDRLDVAIARTDNAFEKSRAFTRLGGTWSTAPQWLADNGRMSIKRARADFRYGRRLAQLTTIMAAVVGGIMSGWQARRLCNAASTADRLRNLVAAQLFFLEQSEVLDSFEFGAAIEHWTEVNYGDEIARRAERADRNRRLNCSKTLGGVRYLEASLHPVWGAMFDTVLARITDELFAADWARAKQTHGNATTAQHLWRTPAQRRHDALIVMAMRAESSAPNAAARRPLVSVLVDFKTIHGRVCELEDGTHLAVDQVVDLMKLADLERAVWGPDDRISVSKKSRVFRGAERRAVELRDRHCTQPGCHEPPEQCDVDHVHRFEDGGPTTQENGRLRCPADHEGRRADPASRPAAWEHRLDDVEPHDLDEADTEVALDADLTAWQSACAPDSEHRGHDRTQRAESSDAPPDQSSR